MLTVFTMEFLEKHRGFPDYTPKPRAPKAETTRPSVAENSKMSINKMKRKN